MEKKEMYEWIDGASYEELLKIWRFAPVGDPLFQGEVGSYYSKQLAKKRELLDADMTVKISKRIGWVR